MAARSAKRKTRKVTVDLAEYGKIIEATQERTLSEAERKVLEDARAVLQRLAGPPNTETSDAVLGKEKTEKGEPKKSGGTGRRPRSDFASPNIVPLKNKGLESGQLCQCGCGRLYPLKRPLHDRYFTGQAALEVTFFEREQLRCSSCGTVFTPDLPEGAEEDSYAPSAKSVIALAKYGLGTPFYRQAMQYSALGVPIAASVLWVAVSSAIPSITPAYDYLFQFGADGEVAEFDDTTMPILDFKREPDDKRTGLHTTGIVCTRGEVKVAIFASGRDHAGENRAALLSKRNPSLPKMIQMSDALAANTAYISSDELIALCLAHGRRNFIKIIDSFPVECRHVIRAIGTVYHHDSLSKKEGHTPQQRLEYHQQMSAPVMAELKEWLEEQVAARTAEPNSNFGKATDYMLRHWHGLTMFLREAGAPLDSNAVERILKKVVLMRKNSLFYKTAKGARTGDIYLSLIATCQLNKVNPHEYLTAIQTHSVELKATPADWMPWTFKETLRRLQEPAPAPT